METWLQFVDCWQRHLQLIAILISIHKCARVIHVHNCAQWTRRDYKNFIKCGVRCNQWRKIWERLIQHEKISRVHRITVFMCPVVLDKIRFKDTLSTRAFVCSWYCPTIIRYFHIRKGTLITIRNYPRFKYPTIFQLWIYCQK